MPTEFLVENSSLGQKALQLSRIILLAMVAAVVMFVCFTVVTKRGTSPDPNHWPLISFVAGFLAATNLVMSVVITRITTAQFRKQVAVQPEFYPEELLGGYQTQMIVSAALLEGAAFFNTIAYMIEQQWWSLATVGVVVVAMLQKFPTARSLEHWVRTQSELIEMEKGQR